MTFPVEQPHTAVGHSRHEAAQYPATCATCREEADLCTCATSDGCDIHGTAPGSTAAPRFERTFASELSANAVAVAVLADGRLEVTFISPDEMESWGERLDLAASNEVATALRTEGV